MKDFSMDTAGFTALTITELLVQQCVMKGLLTGDEVTGLLKAAAYRHEMAAERDEEKTLINTEAARLIHAMLEGLSPLLNPERVTPKPRPNRKKGRKKKVKSKVPA